MQFSMFTFFQSLLVVSIPLFIHSNFVHQVVPIHFADARMKEVVMTQVKIREKTFSYYINSSTTGLNDDDQADDTTDNDND